MARLEWNGDHCKQLVFKASWECIRRAAFFYFERVQDALNVSNPRPYANSSVPPDPPHKRTGFGAANVLAEYDEASLSARIGVATNAMYMIFLELGTEGGKVILSKTGKFLAWMGKDGKMVFRRKVITKRQKPRSFLLGTLKRFMDLIALHAGDGGSVSGAGGSGGGGGGSGGGGEPGVPLS
jgi:uncharacterized membrane protein YgcG